MIYLLQHGLNGMSSDVCNHLAPLFRNWVVLSLVAQKTAAFPWSLSHGGKMTPVRKHCTRCSPDVDIFTDTVTMQGKISILPSRENIYLQGAGFHYRQILISVVST